MKTLREHMLERDRAVESRLAAMRATLLATVAEERRAGAARSGEGPAPLAVLRLLWRELFVPCRATWTTLAAVWVGLLALNLANRSADAAMPQPTAREMAAIYAIWREQQRLATVLSFTKAGPAPVSDHSPEPDSGAARPLGGAISMAALPWV